MRRAGLLILLGVAAGCGGAPGEALTRHLKTPLPRGARVLHFAGDQFKDPWFLWEIRSADRAFINALVANAALAPAPPGMDRGTPMTTDIRWWPEAELPGLPELYFRDPGPTDGSYYRVWVDRERGRIYILFANT